MTEKNWSRYFYWLKKKHTCVCIYTERYFFCLINFRETEVTKCRFLMFSPIWGSWVQILLCKLITWSNYRKQKFQMGWVSGGSNRKGTSRVQVIWLIWPEKWAKGWILIKEGIVDESKRRGKECKLMVKSEN